MITMNIWNVDHRKRPEDDECPVCGEQFDHAKEYYPEAEKKLYHDEAGKKFCIEAGVASQSADPTLVIYYHWWETA